MKAVNAIGQIPLGLLASFAMLVAVAPVALADGMYTSVPPVAVPVESERARQGTVIAIRHPRTTLTDGSGRAVWEDPNCGLAPHVNDWWLGDGRYTIIDPPNWLTLPMRANGWLAIGIVSGLHVRLAPPVSRTDRIREIVQADPSVRPGSYCIYEEFYRSPGDPSAGGIAYWSRIQVTALLPTPKRQPPVNADNSGWPTPSPVPYVPATSFFPPRPQSADLRYRTGVLIQFGAGNKSGYAAIRDTSGRKFGYFTGWPMYIDGKQTHCADPPASGRTFDPILCDGGWPARIVIGLTRVRIYYWHAVAPWGKPVDVTDEIDLAP